MPNRWWHRLSRETCGKLIREMKQVLAISPTNARQPASKAIREVAQWASVIEARASGVEAPAPRPSDRQPDRRRLRL